MIGHVKKFLSDESGSATVELVIWMPVFVLILGLVLDASMAMMAHARMWDVARDTTRQVSIGAMDATQAVTYATSEAKVRDATPIVTADDLGGEVWVDISLPIADVTVFGVLKFLASDRITAKVTMMQEPT